MNAGSTGAAVAQSQAQLFGQAVVNALAVFGLAMDPSKRYRMKSLYDTQTIPAAAGSTVDFFATATSSARLHANGEYGCNLNEPGLVPDKMDFLVLAYGFEIVESNGGAVADANDAAILNDYGQLVKVWINNQLSDENIPLNACGMNRGFRVDHSLLGAAAAVDFDHISNGTPGGPATRGYELPAFHRLMIEGGETIKATVGHNGASALAADVEGRVHFVGIEIKAR